MSHLTNLLFPTAIILFTQLITQNLETQKACADKPSYVQIISENFSKNDAAPAGKKGLTQAEQGFVFSSGVDIFYSTFGSGVPLLIINGGPGMSSEGFVPLAQELSQNHKTILFDQRGTGKSIIESPSEENVTMDLMIADMEALRNHLKIDSWAVLGHSFGGMLGAYYAAKHPEKISAIVFSSSGGLDMELFTYLDIAGMLTPLQRDSLNYWNQRIQQGDSSYTALLGRGRALAPAYLYNQANVPIIAERLTQGNFDINRLVFADMQKIQFDCKEPLKFFTSPTLIIQGADDIIDRQTALRTQAVLPQAKLVVLDYCGHYGWLDQKLKYFEAIGDFLKSIDG